MALLIEGSVFMTRMKRVLFGALIAALGMFVLPASPAQACDGVPVPNPLGEEICIGG